MTDLGMLLIISGPSGVGKTTIVHHVERQLGGRFSVSMTTRPKSAGDIEGVDYHFVDQVHFKSLRDSGQLLEWAEVFGHSYGTPKAPVVEALANGELMILEIDVEGALQVKSKLPEAFAVFLLPPNEEVLLGRLRRRQREDEVAIQRRFAKAKHEIARAHACGVYDAFVVNEDLQVAVEQTTTLVRGQRGPSTADESR